MVPLIGAAFGVAVVLLLVAASANGLRLTPPRWVGGLGVALATVLGGILLAVAASGYTERSTALASSPPGAAWLVRQPGYAADDTPVALQARIIATLAGDRLRHPLRLLGSVDECAEIGAAADDRWVVVNISEVPLAADAEAEGFSEYAREVQERELATARCLDDRVAVYRDPQVRIYAPEGTPRADRTGIAKKLIVNGLSAGPPS
jgi:hypothetical protein